MAFNPDAIERKELLAFSILRGENGRLILDYLRKNYAVDMPAYSPNFPPENAIWRDGARSVIDQLEWITQNLESILHWKDQQEHDNGLSIDR